MWADNSSRGRSSQVFEMVCRVFARRNLSQEARRPPPCQKSIRVGFLVARNQQATASARAPNTTTPKKVDSMHAESPSYSVPVPQKKLHAVHNPPSPIPLPHPASLWQPLRVVMSSDLGRDKPTGLDSSGIPLASITSSRLARGPALTGKPSNYRR